MNPVPELLRGVWQRNLPLIRERLDQLDATADAATAGTLAADDRELAQSNAHKLAGSLGTFGFPIGSQLARAIEVLLEADAPLDAPQLRHHTTELRTILDLT